MLIAVLTCTFMHASIFGAVLIWLVSIQDLIGKGKQKHSLLHDSPPPPLNLSQKSRPPPFASPHWNLKIWFPLFVVPPIDL